MSRNIHQPASDALQIANLAKQVAELQRAVRNVRTPLKTKNGVPSDADFASTPADGTEVVDTLNHRLYVRSGGVWKYTALT